MQDSAALSSLLTNGMLVLIKKMFAGHEKSVYMLIFHYILGW